jgi:hypothetical protein
MNPKSRETRQRIILYGRSVILGTIAASLRKQQQFELIPLSPPCPSVQELGEMQPDVILFDLETARPEAAFSLLADCPGLQLIGIDPDRNQVLIWSEQHLHELSVQDLVDVIHGETHGDGKIRGRGDKET